MTHTRTADEIASDAAHRPSAAVQTESFRKERPEVVGPESPEPPFPITMAGPVQKGFGRGGKDLGCPTANLPDESLHSLSSIAPPGVYFGYAQVVPEASDMAFDESERRVWPMAMSLGWNPFYKNERLSAEVHIIHEYKHDFYDKEMRVLVLGYIRPELDYTTRGMFAQALIADIETDLQVARRSLARPAYAKFASDSFFASPKAVQPEAATIVNGLDVSVADQA